MSLVNRIRRYFEKPLGDAQQKLVSKVLMLTGQGLYKNWDCVCYSYMTCFKNREHDVEIKFLDQGTYFKKPKTVAIRVRDYYLEIPKSRSGDFFVFLKDYKEQEERDRYYREQKEYSDRFNEAISYMNHVDLKE